MSAILFYDFLKQFFNITALLLSEINVLDTFNTVDLISNLCRFAKYRMRV